MKMTARVRRILAVRREIRDMGRDGFARCEPSFEIVRGGRLDEIITDVRISRDGKSIWYKVGKPCPP